MARVAEHLVARAPPRARKPIDRMPRDIEPMLAVLSQLPPDSEHYNFEYKWDGVRALAYLDGGQVRMISRNKKELGFRYPELSGLKHFSTTRIEVVAADL